MEISCGPFNVTQRYAKPRVGSDWKKGSRNAIRDSRDMTQANYGSEIRNITLYVEVKASAASTYEQWVSSIKLKEENIFLFQWFLNDGAPCIPLWISLTTQSTSSQLFHNL